MDDLTARITAALDHAERLARAAMIFNNHEPVTGSPGKHARHWEPEAVLDLIAAHREILAWCQRANELLPGAGGLKVLQMLAKAHRIEVPE